MPALTSRPAIPRRAAVGLLAGLVGLVALGCGTAFLVRSLNLELATELDADLAGYLVRNRRPWLTTVSRAASWLADLAVVAVLVLTVGGVAWARSRRWHALWIPSLAGGGALAISATVKVITARARPPLSSALVDAYGHAFPSGHALRALAVHGALAWLVTAGTRSRAVRVLAWAFASVLIAVVGFARMSLGVHWLTDVLAGYVLGGAWLALVLVFAAPPAARTSGWRRSICRGEASGTVRRRQRPRR